jgi:hypothetical protein
MNQPGWTLRTGVFDHTPRMSFIDLHGNRTGLCVELVTIQAFRPRRSADGRRSGQSQAIAVLPIGARGGLRHHRGTANE